MTAPRPEPRGWPSLLRCLAVMLGGCLLAGCGQFLMLRDDIRDSQNTVTWLEGQTTSPTCTECPTIVVALADAAGKQVLAYRVFERPGDFALAAPVDSRYLFAFNDINGDFEFQPDEPAAWHELARPGTPIALSLQHPGATIPPQLRLGNLFEARGAVLGRFGIQLGAVMPLDAPLFDYDIAGIGMWRPVHFLKAGHAGIYFLAPYAPHKTPVLFIHGIGGSPRDFATMINALDHRRFQPWVLYYPSGLELPAVSNGLLGLLSALHLRYRFDDLHLVAHSMGGLVGRGYLAACAEAENCEYIRSFTSLSSPFGGDPAARQGVDYAPVVMPVWKSLAPGSDFLDELFARPLPRDVPHFLLFGYRNTSHVRSDSSDGTIRLNSQLRPEAQRQATALFGYDEDHMGILDSAEVHAQVGRILRDRTPGRIAPWRSEP